MTNKKLTKKQLELLGVTLENRPFHTYYVESLESRITLINPTPENIFSEIYRLGKTAGFHEGVFNVQQNIKQVLGIDKEGTEQ